jgi:hypothetical protein
MNDLGHLQAAFRPYAMLSAEERISWIRQDRWIGYPRADHILKRLAELLSHPPRDRMPCLLLFGATGMGKTNRTEIPPRQPVELQRDHRNNPRAGCRHSDAAGL